MLVRAREAEAERGEAQRITPARGHLFRTVEAIHAFGHDLLRGFDVRGVNSPRRSPPTWLHAMPLD